MESSTDVVEQEVHQEALRSQFFGRAKLLSAAEEMVKQVCPKGGMVVIEAGPGEGKTVFMVNVVLPCWKSKSANYVESDKSNIMIYCLHEQHFFLPDSTLKVSSVQCMDNLFTADFIFFYPLLSKAALAFALKAELRSRQHPECDVISYSASASQSACSVENLLRCLVQWLRKVRGANADSPLPHSYK